MPEYSAFTVWKYVAILILTMVAFAIWIRPCELYRTKVVASHSEFGWTDTVCAPQPPKGCHCANVANYEWVIGEWVDAPQRLDDPQQQVIPKVSF